MEILWTSTFLVTGQFRSTTAGNSTDLSTRQVNTLYSILWSLTMLIIALDNASCDLPIKTLNCEIQLLHYFSSPGEYFLPVVLYNQVSYEVIPLKVNIYEGIMTIKPFICITELILNILMLISWHLADHKDQLGLVVVPIASACVAIVIIAFGIGLYVYTRRK